MPTKLFERKRDKSREREREVLKFFCYAISGDLNDMTRQVCSTLLIKLNKNGTNN